MRTGQIGSLTVSAVGLGCNNFGRALDQSGTNAVVNAALDAGMNYFDTASNYGEGQSELMLGKALGARRSDVVVATKFGMPIAGVDGSGGANPVVIRSTVERSLSQLNTDRIDLLQLHVPDPRTPIAETLGCLGELVSEGKAIEIGCSQFGAVEMAEAFEASNADGLPRFVSNQIEYSLVNRDVEANGLVPLAELEDVALLPFYPLASGLLTGKKRKGLPSEGRLNMDRYQRFLTDENYDLVERLRLLADSRGVTMATAALSWLLSRSTVPSVTPGATSPDQVKLNAEAAMWQPSAGDLSELATL